MADQSWPTRRAVLQAAGWPQGPEWVLIVGHQPTLGEVAAKLLGAPEGLSLRKSGLIWFELRQRNREQEIVLRAVIGPDKVKTAEWLQMMEAAHGIGLRSTVTITVSQDRARIRSVVCGIILLAGQSTLP